MNRRTLTTMALLCLGIIFATALPKMAVAQSNTVGMWNLNLAKSTFSPGPPPRSQTLNRQAEGQSLRVNSEVIDAQGNSVKAILGPLFYDGKSYPVTGTPDYDASSYKQINGSTVEITRTKAGKTVQMVTQILSADGKTLTFTTTGINASGQQINNVAVYDKQ